jgi:hypothetical protein
MKRFTWKRAAAALALMAILSLAVPPPAQAAGRGIGGPAAWSDGAWGWAAWFWGQLATLLRGTDGARPHAAAKSGTAVPTYSSGDIGPVIDPNGSPPPPTPP